MAYERYQKIVTKEEFFKSWTPEQLANLDDKLKEYIYQKYLVKCIVFQRDSFKCQNENCLSHNSPLTIHHIKFQKNGGEDKPKNCVTICRSCHNSFHKGSRSLTFNGMTYQIHRDTDIDWKEVKFKSKQIRKENQQYHGYNISWEMVCMLLSWLRQQEYEDIDDD